MKHVTVTTFKEVVSAEQNNSSVDFINVCTPAEYKEKHIHGVRSGPLDEIEKHVSEFSSKKTIYVHCRSGRRGVQAIEKLRTLGIKAELVNVEGGLLAWEASGYATRSLTSHMPLMRQVLVAAGGLVLAGHLLSLLFGPGFLLVSASVGAGLLFAGITGWCGMAFVLARMPWNK